MHQAAFILDFFERSCQSSLKAKVFDGDCEEELTIFDNASFFKYPQLTPLYLLS